MFCTIVFLNKTFNCDIVKAKSMTCSFCKIFKMISMACKRYHNQVQISGFTWLCFIGLHCIMGNNSYWGNVGFSKQLHIVESVSVRYYVKQNIYPLTVIYNSNALHARIGAYDYSSVWSHSYAFCQLHTYIYKYIYINIYIKPRRINV